MRIERGQHAVDGALDQFLLVGLGDVLRADPFEYVTKDAELLIGRCTGCIGGALKRDDYLAAIAKAGFTRVEIVSEDRVPVDLWADFPEEAKTLSRQEIKAALGLIASVKVSARK